MLVSDMEIPKWKRRGPMPDRVKTDNAI